MLLTLFIQIFFTDHKGQEVAHNSEVLEYREGSPQEYESSLEVGARSTSVGIESQLNLLRYKTCHRFLIWP